MGSNALNEIRRPAGGDGAGHYLADAIPRRIATLIVFNDDAREDFAEIRALIVRARDMAQAELAATAQPERIAAGETQRSVARSYNVSQATISRLAA